MRFSRIIVALFGFAVSIYSAPAAATSIPEPLFKFNTGYNEALSNFNIGNEFKTGPVLYVSAIGAHVATTQITSGVTNTAYQAFLYADDNTTVLASAVIPVGTAVDVQGFAYVPLSYTLTAGTNYVLTAHSSTLNGTSSYTYSLAPGLPTGTWDLGTTFIQNWYDATMTFAPTQTNNPAYMEFMGGNLLVADELPVPEPSTLALLGLGAIGLAIRTRRRRTLA